MTINDISMLFKFFGGLGMFLYGMKMMSDGLQKTAGNKMKHLLSVLTDNRLKAVLVGAMITAIIQSSGATTVMIVGFVNAGLMSLVQAVGVIMGANIGTTITAWIVSAGQLGEVFAFFKPSFIAPILIGIGAMIVMFSREHKKQNRGEVLIALGLLFAGLEWMSSSVKPYTNAPIFAQIFTMLGKNPILGILAGAIITGLMQSSSASVGVLQTLAMNGVVTASSAIYICLGSNIGSCYTGLISCIGASKNAKRAAVINLLFNCLGVIVFGIIMFIIFKLNKVLAYGSINSVQISIFHTIFNITNTIIMFPLAKLLVEISGKLIKGKDIDSEEELLELQLDDRILTTPSLAIETTLKEVLNMANLVYNNIKMSVDSTINHNDMIIKEVLKNEQVINKYETSLIDYLVKISDTSLNDKQRRKVKNLLYTVNDLERIGDHAENVAELSQDIERNSVKFSDKGIKELEMMDQMVLNALNGAIKSRKCYEAKLVKDVIAYEDVVDGLEEEIREEHIIRLSRRECQTEAGVIFLDLLSNLERVSDHAVNIAEYVQSENEVE
ncbi:Na/Pi cotransporter family protein [Sedimentibacter sp. zth1]|uniref:Na/Pi cotransporter family protein n=1 Tax=Sedimentibacter sp. zth1 TaxID=2816908 RepID=UPI001A932ACA|nr:Na/Pi cotransporter family protein [Sedimentibacter sp. zth1]QSX05785.1 Na/Pi cotransporter family protein [Sedimentibacter sp. zth1]